MAFRVARRLGGVPAGAAAAGAYAVAPWMLRNSALGNSEGLLVALGLAAVDRHLAGRTRHAFLFGIGAALLRPEAWPLIGLYGLWLFWRDPGARKLVAAAFVALPVLWLLPELWGSGDLLRAAHRAHNPRANSAAFSDDPIREVVRQFGDDAHAGAVDRPGGARRDDGAAPGLGPPRAPRRHRPRAGRRGVGRRGRRDDQRRLQRQRPLPDHAGGGRLRAGRDGHRLADPGPARALVRERARRRGGLRRGRHRLRRAERDRLDAVRASVYYQARLTDGLAGAIAQAGGPDRLKACGTTYTGAFQVPSVAWLLNEHTTAVRSASAPGDAPPQVPARGAAVADDERQPPAFPAIESIGGEAAVKTFAISGGWRIVGRCGERRSTEVARPRARIARLGTARLAVSLPKSLLVLAFLVGLSLALRTQAIHARFWIDEGLSVGISSHPLGDIPGVLRKDGSPPLYYLILKLWMSVFGSGEADTHALSVAFAIFTVPAAWLGGRALFGDRAAWIAALLAAINPFLTYYSQETRMYALVALLSTIVTATFVVTFVQGRRAWLPVFSVSLALIAYAHNWGLFLAIGTVAALVPIYRQAADRRAVVRDALLAYAITAVLYLPWLPILISQAQHTGAPWAERPTFQAILNGLANLLGGAAPAMAFALGAGFGLSTILAGARRSPRARAALSVAIMGLTTLAVAWLASQASPAWSNRYFSVFMGPVLLLGAAGLARGGRLGLVVIAILVAFWFNPRTGVLDTKSDAHTVAVLTRDRLERGDMVVAIHPEQGPVMHYYLPQNIGLRWADAMGPVKDPLVFDWRDALDRLKAAKPTPTEDALVATLKPGEKILAIFPIIRTARWGAPWTSEVRKRSAQWQRVLDRDKRLSRTLAAPVTEGRPLPKGVRAVLYERK